MADLDIMKALRDPRLQFDSLSESRAAGTTTEVAIDVEEPGSTLEEKLNDYDPEQYVENFETEPSLPEQLDGQPMNTSAVHQLCSVHTDSTYEGSRLELLAIENWMELLHTQTKSCIFLAKGNWQARQAATAISMAKGRKTCILSEKTCWTCIAERFPNITTDGQMVTFIA